MAVARKGAFVQEPSKPKRLRRSHTELIQSSPFEDRNGSRPHNASEVVALADSRFLFCDNNIGDSLFEIRLKQDGTQAGRLVRHAISGVSTRFLDDFESMAVAKHGSRYYVIVATSFSLKAKTGKSNKAKRSLERESLLRVADAGTEHAQAEIIPGFRSWLLDHSPDLGKAWRRSWKRIPDDEGLNIEGLAWNPLTKELLFGLRTPVLDGRPVILRVHVKDVAGIWNLNNFEMLPPVLLQLPPLERDLGERGIRTMEFDPNEGRILIVTGNSISHSDAPFELYEWDGNAKGTVKRFDRVRFHPKFRVEGVTPGTIGGRPALIFVDDRGGYQVLWGDDERLK